MLDSLEASRNVALGKVKHYASSLQFAVAGIDRRPFDADGAHRHAVFLGIARAEKGRGQIGAGTPIGGDRDIDFAARSADIGIGNRDQRFRTGRHHQLAGIARGDLQLGGIADAVACLVERDFKRIRRFRRGGSDIPAGTLGRTAGPGSNLASTASRSLDHPADGAGGTANRHGGEFDYHWPVRRLTDRSPGTNALSFRTGFRSVSTGAGSANHFADDPGELADDAGGAAKSPAGGSLARGAA